MQCLLRHRWKGLTLYEVHKSTIIDLFVHLSCIHIVLYYINMYLYTITVKFPNMLQQKSQYLLSILVTKVCCPNILMCFSALEKLSRIRSGIKNKRLCTCTPPHFLNISRDFRIFYFKNVYAHHHHFPKSYFTQQIVNSFCRHCWIAFRLGKAVHVLRLLLLPVGILWV